MLTNTEPTQVSRVGGLTASYFPGSKLARPAAVRIDSTIDFSSAGRVGSGHGSLTGEAEAADAAAVFGVAQLAGRENSFRCLKLDTFAHLAVLPYTQSCPARPGPAWR
jgi:hypothetical protein